MSAIVLISALLHHPPYCHCCPLPHCWRVRPPLLADAVIHRANGMCHHVRPILLADAVCHCVPPLSLALAVRHHVHSLPIGDAVRLCVRPILLADAARHCVRPLRLEDPARHCQPPLHRHICPLPPSTLCPPPLDPSPRIQYAAVRVRPHFSRLHPSMRSWGSGRVKGVWWGTLSLCWSGRVQYAMRGAIAGSLAHWYLDSGVTCKASPMQTIFCTIGVAAGLAAHAAWRQQRLLRPMCAGA
eukprot:scaffold78199_cov21-Tisochrysis_lutea.AAC.1